MKLTYRFVTTLLIVVFVGLGFVGCGSSSHTKTRPYKGLTLTLSDSTLLQGMSDTIRFGNLHSGEIARLPFRIENQSSRPIIVLQAERTCGCTEVEYKREPIAPKGHQLCHIIFDTRGLWGWQLKYVDLKIAGSQRPLRLWCEARVE